MAKGTPATVALTKSGVAFTLHEYDYDPNAARIGMQAAEALGVAPARLLKTLMAKAGGVCRCGQKKRGRAFIDQAALAYAPVIVKGGRRGLQIELAPADLVRVLG